MTVEHRSSGVQQNSSSHRVGFRQLTSFAVVFAAGFATALWFVAPPRVEAHNEPIEDVAGIEFGREGLKIQSRSKDALLVVNANIDGVPHSYPVVPGGEPTVVPGEEVGEAWGLFEIRFRPCRYGDCTDPVPPPDIFSQGGVVVWSPRGKESSLCKVCDRKKCCPEDR